MSTTNNVEETQAQPTEQDLRDLGSAEASAWTITVPGQAPMTLDEHAQHHQARNAQREEHYATMRAEMESEAAIRATG